VSHAPDGALPTSLSPMKKTSLPVALIQERNHGDA
jgi:hypothetical protein